MISLVMYKNYFHNNKLVNENRDKKKLAQISNLDKKAIVDVNILLNRVKIEEKNRTKRKIIFFTITTSSLILFGTFISIIR
tara:strand:+ start:1003 stop:1245 length:243 start_codon:yes stop_codon:yes gene_type:complete